MGEPRIGRRLSGSGYSLQVLVRATASPTPCLRAFHCYPSRLLLYVSFLYDRCMIQNLRT